MTLFQLCWTVLLLTNGTKLETRKLSLFQDDLLRRKDFCVVCLLMIGIKQMLFRKQS